MLWHAKTFDDKSFVQDEVKAATCRSRMLCKRPTIRNQLRRVPYCGNNFFALPVTKFLFPVCVDAAGNKCVYSEGDRRGPKGDWIASKANTRIPNCTYNVDVHSSLTTSSWLYDWSHTGCTFRLQYYHL